MLVDETANATNARGLSPSNRDPPVDINNFDVAHAHAHEGALRKTAKQMGVTLEGKLHECKGCSMAKGIRLSIPSKTHCRKNKRLSRVFVDFEGKQHVTSMGGNTYPMIIRDDFSRYAWLYFISYKSDAAEAFKQFLAGVEGIPSEGIVVRSDNGSSEFNQGEFGQLCREINIKQEFTTADSPEYNGVAERRLAMIESAALAAKIQASELFPGFDIPEKPWLWAEAMSWACDAYNRTATVAIPGNLSPHEIFYGEIPQDSPVPFLKPGYCRYQRTNKMDLKARECIYLGPARNHPRESKRIFEHTGMVIITRNVPWAHVRSVRSLITRSKPSVVGEGDESG